MGNQSLFDSFITFRKPIVAAVNGPAFGGGVTQATLCNSAVSSRQATYSLPFSHWRVSPEGCSSAHTARVVGAGRGRRMLAGGWIPDADEAKLIGLVAEVSGPSSLLGVADKSVKSLTSEHRRRAFLSMVIESEVG